MTASTGNRPSLHRIGRWDAIRVIARREIVERARTTAFKVGTGLMLVVAAAAVVLPQVWPDQDDPEWTVAVTGAAPAGFEAAIEAITAAEQVTITLEPSTADPAVLARDDAIDAVLVDGRELVSEHEPPDRLAGLLAGAVSQTRLVEDLEGLGVDVEDARALLEVDPLAVTVLDEDDEMATRQTVAFLGVVILFMAILVYGAWVLYSVLEEKSNRIVEIVVSAVRSTDLLAGKVIGIGALALAQLCAVVATGAAVAAVTGSLPDLPAGTGPAALAGLVWFMLGFAFYATGYAAGGALVSRQEDAQSAVTPLVSLVVVAYLVTLGVVTPDPGGTASRVVSLIPPITPLAMPSRIATGEVAPWEVALGVVLVLVATVGMVALAARIYDRALLRSGQRVSLRAALGRQSD